MFRYWVSAIWASVIDLLPIVTHICGFPSNRHSYLRLPEPCPKIPPIRQEPAIQIILARMISYAIPAEWWITRAVVTAHVASLSRYTYTIRMSTAILMRRSVHGKHCQVFQNEYHFSGRRWVPQKLQWLAIGNVVDD